MEENIITLLGGRVAEQLILDDISTGASNDIERATAIARNMVTRYGFSEKLGPIVYGTDSTEVFLGRILIAHEITLKMLLLRLIPKFVKSLKMHMKRQRKFLKSMLTNYIS